MTEAVIVTNEELAILCDIVGGWSSKLAENADADKLQALDRLRACQKMNHSLLLG
jgi:hypothetical protein